MGEMSATVSDAPRFQHHGSIGELYGIYFRNLVLKIVTLGIYHFWAKTRIRHYLWSQTAFDGERFEYTGTARELLRGYLKAMAILIPTLIVFQVLIRIFQTNAVVATVLNLLFYAGFIVFAGLARFASWRYRLSRTRWRSIRMAMTGSAVTFGFMTLGHVLLTGLTLGLYYPRMSNELTRYLLGNTWFGTIRCAYDGRAGDLFVPFAWRWVATLFGISGLSGVIGVLVIVGADGPGNESIEAFIPILIIVVPALLIGLSIPVLWLPYRAVQYRYFAEHSRLGAMEFTLGYSGGRYSWMFISSLTISLLTLRFGFPIVIMRWVKFTLGHLTANGTLDYAAILQSQEAIPAGGEGIAEALDIGDVGI